jgi:hypothetical protein
LEDSSNLISTIIRTTPIAPKPTPIAPEPTPIAPEPTPTNIPAPTTPPSNDHVPAPTPHLRPSPPPVVSTHPMVTRSCAWITRPNPKYAGHVSTVSPLHRLYKDAFNDPNWRNAMYD